MKRLLIVSLINPTLEDVEEVWYHLPNAVIIPFSTEDHKPNDLSKYSDEHKLRHNNYLGCWVDSYHETYIRKIADDESHGNKYVLVICNHKR